MAGIRGSKNPIPTKEPTATGLFKQRDTVTKHHGDLLASAYASDRKGPSGRNNKLSSNTNSMRQNPSLKRGTSDRS